MTQQNQEYTLHSQILLNPEARFFVNDSDCAFAGNEKALIADRLN